MSSYITGQTIQWTVARGRGWLVPHPQTGAFYARAARDLGPTQAAPYLQADGQGHAGDVYWASSDARNSTALLMSTASTHGIGRCGNIWQISQLLLGPGVLQIRSEHLECALVVQHRGYGTRGMHGVDPDVVLDEFDGEILGIRPTTCRLAALHCLRG